jgi:hypothetical protein
VADLDALPFSAGKGMGRGQKSKRQKKVALYTYFFVPLLAGFQTLVVI